ncbi:hypothetical protein ScPMuIL_014487 [Solemya velum]
MDFSPNQRNSMAVLAMAAIVVGLTPEEKGEKWKVEKKRCDVSRNDCLRDCYYGYLNILVKNYWDCTDNCYTDYEQCLGRRD